MHVAAAADTPSKQGTPIRRSASRSRDLLTRIVVVAILFASELLALSVWLDTSSIDTRAGVRGWIGVWGPSLLRGVVAYAAVVVMAGWTTSRRDAVDRLAVEAASRPIRWQLFAAHLVAIAMFARISAVLYDGAAPAAGTDLLAIGWLAAGLTAVGCAAVAILPWTIWMGLVRSAGLVWLYALIGVTAAAILGTAVQSLWQPVSHLTFTVSRALLVPFVDDVLADPSRLAVGTKRFSVIIAPSCSGLEGIGLILAFGTTWLVAFRRDYRFPHAAALLPVAVVLMLLL